jgi:hypothetical protein
VSVKLKDAAVLAKPFVEVVPVLMNVFPLPEIIKELTAAASPKDTDTFCAVVLAATKVLLLTTDNEVEVV